MRRQSGIASSTRTAAPRPHPERQPPAGTSPSAASFDEAQCNYPKGIPMDTVTAISDRRLEALHTPAGAPGRPRAPRRPTRAAASAPTVSRSVPLRRTRTTSSSQASPPTGTRIPTRRLRGRPPHPSRARGRWLFDQEPLAAATLWPASLSRERAGREPASRLGLLWCRDPCRCSSGHRGRLGDRFVAGAAHAVCFRQGNSFNSAAASETRRESHGVDLRIRGRHNASRRDLYGEGPLAQWQLQPGPGPHGLGDRRR